MRLLSLIAVLSIQFSCCTSNLLSATPLNSVRWIQDDDTAVQFQRGDWVKFSRNNQKYPVAGRIYEIKPDNFIIVVETLEPQTGELVRLALRRIELTKITIKEAEKLNKQSAEGTPGQFEIGQSVQAFYKGEWVGGQVLDQPNTNFVVVRHGQRGKKEMIARKYPTRAIKDVSEDRVFPVFQKGDHVLAKIARGANEPTWQPGEVTRVAGTYVYVRLDDDRDKDDLQFLKANICHKTSEKPIDPIGIEELKFEVGDLVQFKKGDDLVDAKIIKIGTEWITVRYFDEKREKHYNRRMKPSQLIVSKQASADSQEDSSGSRLAVEGETQRNWTSATGNHSFPGRLIAIKGESVEIAGTNGRDIVVELSKLSSQDRDYVAEVKKKSEIGD